MESMCVQQVETNQLLSLPRLLNNRMLELRQQFLSRPRKTRDQMVNLRQNLFGSSDKKENLSFAQDEMNKMTQADSRRWNFDMNTGEPTEGQYHWDLITETNKALDTSGRLTCLTAVAKTANHNNNKVPLCNGLNNGSSSSSLVFATSSKTPFGSSSPSSPNAKRAVTTTTFATTTTPTAVISKKCVKRLQKSVPNSKVPKLITDYFKEVKPAAVLCKGKDVVVDEKDVVSNRMIEILKIRSMNVR